MDKLLREMKGDLNDLFEASRNQYKSIYHNFNQRLNSLEKMHQHDEVNFRDILIKPVLSKINPLNSPFLHDICSKSFELIASQKDDEDEELITGKLEEFQKIFNSLIEKMKKYGIKSSEIKNKDGVNINDYIDSYVESIIRYHGFDETDDIMSDIMENMEDLQEAIRDLDKSAKSWKASAAKSGKASTAKSGKASASKERKKSPGNPEMEKLKQRIKHLLKENEKLVSNEDRMKSLHLKVLARMERESKRRIEDRIKDDKKISDLLKKNEELERHIGYQDNLIETHWKSVGRLADLLSKSKKKRETLEILNENKAGVIKGRDTQINQLARENKELQKQLKKANVNIELLGEREKACKQEIKEAAKEKATLVKLIKSKEAVEKNILAYTNQLQKAYDSMTEKIVLESRAIELSTKKLENMERMRKDLTKSKSREDTIFARFKRLKEDPDVPIVHTQLREKEERTTGKLSLSYDDLLEKFKKHHENMKALSVEGKKFRIVNREDLKDIQLKSKVFTGTRMRERERKRPSIVDNDAELKKLRRGKVGSRTQKKSNAKGKRRRRKKKTVKKR